MYLSSVIFLLGLYIFLRHPQQQQHVFLKKQKKIEKEKNIDFQMKQNFTIKWKIEKTEFTIQRSLLCSLIRF